MLEISRLDEEAQIDPDPFRENYPPKGSLPPLENGFVPLAALPTGDVLSIPVEALARNVIVVGRIGGGKSSYLRVFLAALLESHPKPTIIVLEQKPHDVIDRNRSCNSAVGLGSNIAE